MKCNMECPPGLYGTDDIRCCRACNRSRLTHLENNPELKQYWGKNGFWSKDGCLLPRNKMPPECKDYDCHDYVYRYRMEWDVTGWTMGLETERKV